MMGSQRKRQRLPRVTVLAYSAQDLQRFANSVEQLTTAALTLTSLVGALRDQVDRLTCHQSPGQRAAATRRARQAVAGDVGTSPANGNAAAAGAGPAPTSTAGEGGAG